MTKHEEMQKLVTNLNEAAKAYYQTDTELMTNFEYDAFYDRLLALEKELGIVLPDSPTQNVGYKILSTLPKMKHPAPMLSLDKTKNIQELVEWLKDKVGFLGWKEDGLTVVLTYKDGKLAMAVTRGDGEEGEVITENAMFFDNVPREIAFKGEIVIRGEAIITYSNFKNYEEEFANPRNMVSGTVRQLNTRITASRHVVFVPFNVVSIEGHEENSHSARLNWIKQFGFVPVFGKLVTAENLEETIKWFEKEIENYDHPSDGLVLMYDDIQYGESLGVTAKFPRNGMAFKWKDETAETTLRAVEWYASRTGRLNPVAVFDSVDLEGTTVERASLSNVSLFKNFKMNIGDTIEIFKANKIIPQVANNLTGETYDESLIPSVCPVCGSVTMIKKEKKAEVLYCTNPHCKAKVVGAFEHFASKKCMNIVGLSTATLETFVDKGFLTKLVDIYYLDSYKDQIVEMEGFGKRSYDKLMKGIEDSKKTTFVRFLSSFGIPNVGNDVAKLLQENMKTVGNKCSEEMLRFASRVEFLTAIDGIGDTLADNICSWFAQNESVYREILAELDIEDDVIVEKVVAQTGITDKVFVITGSVEHFANRNALKDFIESKGGKVAGSVSKNTHYLINNDVASTSGKNKKARELGIPVISEEDFLKLI